MVSHFKGKILEWDVVNECLDDNQTTIRNNPNAYDLRKESVWMKVIGEDFIDSAFVYAHRADPNARLILNDYDVEFKGNAKSEALFNLAKRLKNSGIPIDGVGLQCHFDVGQVDAKQLSENIRRYQDIGLSCSITELDIAISSAKTDEAFAQQAKDYKNICKAMLMNDNCSATSFSRLLRQEYYTLTGLRLQEAPQTHHPFIFRNIYEDGSVKVRKVVK